MNLSENQFLVKHYNKFLPLNRANEMYDYVNAKITACAFSLLDEMMSMPDGDAMVRYLDDKTKEEKIAFLRTCKIDVSSRTVDFVKDTENGWPVSYLSIDLEVPLELQVKHNILPMFKTKTSNKQ